MIFTTFFEDVYVFHIREHLGIVHSILQIPKSDWIIFCLSSSNYNIAIRTHCHFSWLEKKVQENRNKIITVFIMCQ